MSDYSYQDLYGALQRADAAGDTEAARAIAQQLAVMHADIHARSLESANANPADPTEGMSGAEKFTAGVGRSAVQTGRGLGQLVGLVDQGTVDDAARSDKPLLSTGAGMAGNIAGTIAQMAVPGAAVGKGAAALNLASKAVQGIGSGAATAGAFGLTQPVESGDSRLGNAAKDAALGAAGGVVGEGVAALARGGREALSPALAALAAKAEAYGIPLTAAQMSDSAFVKTLQSALSKLPFSGQGKLYETQQKAFNRAVGKTFGAEADTITPDVALAAKQKLGGEFDRLSVKNSLTLDDQALSKIAAVTDNAAKVGTEANAKAVSSLADELLAKSNNGVVSGEAYREFDSQLGRMMRQTSDGDRKHYLGELRDAVRGAMDRSISPADQAAWKSARGQYANLKTVEDLVEKSPTGNLSPALLMGRVRAGRGDVAYGGGGDLADLGRIGQQFLKAQVPDSGSAQRMLIYELTKAGAIGGTGAVMGADPTTILGMLALGRGGSSVLNSRLAKAYMQSGLGDSAQPVAGALRWAAPYLLPAAANAGE